MTLAARQADISTAQTDLLNTVRNCDTDLAAADPDSNAIIPSARRHRQRLVLSGSTAASLSDGASTVMMARIRATCAGRSASDQVVHHIDELGLAEATGVPDVRLVTAKAAPRAVSFPSLRTYTVQVGEIGA